MDLNVQRILENYRKFFKIQKYLKVDENFTFQDFYMDLKNELTPEYISEKQKQQQDPDDSSNLDEKNQVIQRKMEQMNKEAKMKMKMQMISSQRQDSIDQIESL